VPASVHRWTREVAPLGPKIRGWREALHRRPELAYEEAETQGLLVETLGELGISYKTYPRSTAVVGWIGTDRPGPVVALRADMDGLPVEESTGWKHRSEVKGRMHACGHDVHMSALLGAAAVLRDHEAELPGPITLLFQPAEEQGERGGAGPLIEHGALEDPKVDFVVGQHVAPEIRTGRIGWGVGPVMASADRFRIEVGGTGGHAATPHRGPDAILAAAEIVQGLQALVSRMRDPADPVVVSVGSIHGGTRDNVLPETVQIEGTVRTLRPDTRKLMERRLRQRVSMIAKSSGATAAIDYEHGYPVTVNHEEATETVVEGLRAELGNAALVPLERPLMGAEDFSRYLEQVPGSFLFLGVGGPGVGGLHSPKFLPGPDAPLHGAAALLAASAALQAG